MADDTNAQVNEESEGQETQGQGTEGQTEDQTAGFQARVDELTRARREAERQNQELVATVARLSAQVVESSARQAPAPLPEIDPDTKKLLDAYVGPQMAQLRAELEQARGIAMQGRLYQGAQGEDPRVLARAQELLPAVLKAGWAPEDALNFARGELSREVPAGGRRDAGGRFTPGVVGANGTLPNPGQRGPPPLPANFDSLSPDKQLDILEKRDVGNRALFGDSD